MVDSEVHWTVRVVARARFLLLTMTSVVRNRLQLQWTLPRLMVLERQRLRLFHVPKVSEVIPSLSTSPVGRCSLSSVGVGDRE